MLSTGSTTFSRGRLQGPSDTAPPDDQTTNRVLVSLMMKLVDEQSADGRSALLGFLHLVDAAPAVKVRLRIVPSGGVTLVMSARESLAD